MPFELDSSVKTIMEEQLQFLYERSKTADAKNIVSFSGCIAGISRQMFTGIRQGRIIAERTEQGEQYYSVSPFAKEIILKQIKRIRELEDRVSDEDVCALSFAMTDLLRILMGRNRRLQPNCTDYSQILGSAEQSALGKMLEYLTDRAETANEKELPSIVFATTDAIRVMYAGQKLPARCP